MNPHLSVVIPTYNRAHYLDHSLEVHLPVFEKYGINLYVFDNASTDNTSDVVKKWQNIYPLIEYHRNDKNYGPDDNIEKALKHPSTKYTWLLGDTYRIPEEGILHLLELFENEKEYSVIVFNLANIVQLNGEMTSDYVDYTKLLGDLGALMTCLSCLVYNGEFLKIANFSRYKNSNFIQTGIIFESLPHSGGAVHWVQAISVEGLQNEALMKNGWYHSHEVFEIACKRWTHFVLSLPVSYKFDAKLKCLLDFGKISKIFTFRNVFNLRRLGILNLGSYRKYSCYFPLTIEVSKVAIFIMCLVPRSIIKTILALRVLFLRDSKNKRWRRIFLDEV